MPDGTPDVWRHVLCKHWLLTAGCMRCRIAADVGDSLLPYTEANGVDLVVVGARGMGAVKRAVMSFIGLGSVSDYVVAHAQCPVAVVKPAPAQEQAAA